MNVTQQSSPKSDHRKMDPQSDFRKGSISALDNSGTEVQNIPCMDKKRARKIAKGKVHPKDDIIGLEDRRRLALERHIKRKRRRRPYVKRKTQLEATENPSSKNLSHSKGKEEDVPGISQEVDEKLEVGVDSTQKQLVNTECEEMNNDLKTSTELSTTELWHVMRDDVSEETKEEVSSGDAGNYEKRQKVEKLNKLLENLLNKMKWETIIKAKVEKELTSRSEEKVLGNEKESPTKMDVKDDVEASWRDKEQMGSDLNLLDDRQRHLEKLALTEEEKLGKTEIRMVEIRENEENDEDGDDDDGFMPRKLFFFSFDRFKEEEAPVWKSI